MIVSVVDLPTRLDAAGLDWIVPSWLVDGRVHGFVTTRNGGVSVGPYATFNVGVACGDDPQAVAENRRRLATYVPSAPIWLRQVHGNGVACVDASNVDSLRANAPTADGAVTREPSIVLTVQVADCMPVLLANRSGRAIGVAHAGWRGLASGVIENTLSAMDCEPSDVVAWLGPAIGARAFEVGDDVVEAFARSQVRDCFTAKSPGKWLADLYAIARTKLARAGVSSVAGGELCTFNDAVRFYSYRRDRVTGRMAAMIWIAS